MTTVAETIVETEWEMFDRVQNLGGRASCQESPNTFRIMRMSQLLAWSQEMRECYLRDLQQAKTAGRNLLTEKYAHMMKWTNPVEYAAIRDRLPEPEPTMEKQYLIELIAAAHVRWQEALADRYPHLAGRGRPLHQSEDRPDATSFETYLIGELMTYSVETLRAYAHHVDRLQRQGGNLGLQVLENMVASYGYPDVETAERKLGGGND